MMEIITKSINTEGTFATPNILKNEAAREVPSTEKNEESISFSSILRSLVSNLFSLNQSAESSQTPDFGEVAVQTNAEQEAGAAVFDTQEAEVETKSGLFRLSTQTALAGETDSAIPKNQEVFTSPPDESYPLKGHQILTAQENKAAGVTEKSSGKSKEIFRFFDGYSSENVNNDIDVTLLKPSSELNKSFAPREISISGFRDLNMEPAAIFSINEIPDQQGARRLMMQQALEKVLHSAVPATPKEIEATLFPSVKENITHAGPAEKSREPFVPNETPGEFSPEIKIKPAGNAQAFEQNTGHFKENPGYEEKATQKQEFIKTSEFKMFDSFVKDASFSDSKLAGADEVVFASRPALQAARIDATTTRIAQVLEQSFMKAGSGLKLNMWQQHQFDMNDGSRMNMMVKKGEESVLVQLSSSNNEMNKFLLVHQQDIEKHIREKLSVDINFMFDAQQGGAENAGQRNEFRPFNKPDSKVGEPSLLGLDENTIPTGILRLGFNRNEWQG